MFPSGPKQLEKYLSPCIPVPVIVVTKLPLLVLTTVIPVPLQLYVYKFPLGASVAANPPDTLGVIDVPILAVAPEFAAAKLLK
jgi:hypothetical protein